MKKMNKGFSMVELIIVIAIMAILAGALAPALIKYINKSRLATDVSTAQTIASAISTALSNESAYDVAPTLTGVTASSLDTGDAFGSEIMQIVDVTTVKVKSKKDMDGTALGGTDFLVDVDPTTNVIKVYVGDTAHEAYPTPVKSLSEKN